ncbi:alpha/beta hydrolase [Youngiibacter multivorans]|uniref:Carboxylesterase n=1 Tax=Youngiibacter multivorans TaxID=937251 RepID=A0ABS4G0S2_9CLOT|nr:carboxylesterase [Youngiibacter multivorans]
MTQGNATRMKCLVLHGFGGGVHEVANLVEKLEKSGFIVACPTLHGHSGDLKEFGNSTCEDWIESAEEALDELESDGDKAAVIGFSMGGLIAANLSERHDLSSVVMINTPIYYWNIPQVMTNLLDDLKGRKLDNTRRYLQAKRNSPIPSMLQFLRLLRDSKPKIGGIKCPLLVIQARDDDTTRIGSASYIYSHVDSDRKSLRYLKEGGHVVLNSSSCDEACDCVLEFLEGKKCIG